MLQNGIQTATTYGPLIDYDHYDKHWVYTTPIHKDSTASTFFGHRSSERECIIKIKKKILNDPIIRKQMMINNGMLDGEFYPEITHIEHFGAPSDGPYEAKTLFFGGDKTVSLRYHSNDYSVEHKRYFMEKPEFSGNLNILESKIKQCLFNPRLQFRWCEYSFCEVLFRANIPLKYVDGYYEFKKHDKCINVKNMQWMPLDAFRPTVIPKEVNIQSLEFFVTQKLCKHIPEMLQNGIQTATTYGPLINYDHYDKHWVYTTPIHEHSTGTTFFGHNRSERECIIKINKNILNDPIIRKQMMINNGMLDGTFYPEITHIDYWPASNGPCEAKTLFFGGDKTVPLQYYWNDYSVESKRYFMEQPEFSGNINILEQAIKRCLFDPHLQFAKCNWYSACEVLFRTNIPLKYVDGYYEFKKSDECINVKQMQWKPLDAFRPSYTPKK